MNRVEERTRLSRIASGVSSEICNEISVSRDASDWRTPSPPNIRE